MTDERPQAVRASLLDACETRLREAPESTCQAAPSFRREDGFGASTELLHLGVPYSGDRRRQFIAARPGEMLRWCRMAGFEPLKTQTIHGHKTVACAGSRGRGFTGRPAGRARRAVPRAVAATWGSAGPLATSTLLGAGAAEARGVCPRARLCHSVSAIFFAQEVQVDPHL